MKKVIALLIAFAMMGTLLAGCGSGKTSIENTSTVKPAATAESTANAETTKPQEVVKCKYVLPGSKPVDYDKVETEINKKMLADGVGVELERQYIAWDAWDQKTNLMLSTGEEFDLLNVMNDKTPLAVYVSRGALADITSAIDQYGDNIKRLNPPIMMGSVTVNSKLYAVPAFWVEFANNPELTVRLDILKQFNISVPTTVEELTSAFETVMKNWKGKDKPYFSRIGKDAGPFNIAWKTYDTFPFNVIDKLFYVNQDGTVKAFPETEEFKKDSQLARSWYKKGLINPDVLVYKEEQQRSQLDSGNWVFHAGTFGNSVEQTIKKNYPTITVDDFGFLNMAPEKPNLRPFGTRNMNAVPVTSKNPEAGVKFINWLYASQENYDLYMYGREGIDFKKIGDKNREDINDQAQNRPLYYADDWMIGNLAYLRPSLGAPTITNKVLFNIDKTAADSIAGNFAFDATNVKAELANVRTVMAANIAPIMSGVVDYDKAYPAALEKLKEAGLDKVMAEYKTQFEIYRKTQVK